MLKPSIKMLLALVVAAGFSLQAYADSLSIVPKRPTTSDTIRFSIIIPNWDCCTQYYYDSTEVTVSDTVIYLSYQYNLPQMCPMILCLDVDKILTYKSAPLRAGKYGVYEAVGIYCSEKPCPLALIAPQRIGEITVHPASGTIEKPVSLRHQVTNARVDGKTFTVRGEVVPGKAGYGISARGVYLEQARGGAVHRIVR